MCLISVHRADSVKAGVIRARFPACPNPERISDLDKFMVRGDILYVPLSAYDVPLLLVFRRAMTP